MSTDNKSKLLHELPATSLPAEEHGGGNEPAAVETAYKAGIKTTHTMTAGEVCDLLGVDPRKGLSAATAAARLDKYGKNTKAKLYAFMLDNEEMTQKRVGRTVSVLRDGLFRSCRAEELVVGDVICLQAGEEVPADSRILLSTQSVTQHHVLSAGQWINRQVKVTTLVDATVPCDHEPFHAVSGNCRFQLRIDFKSLQMLPRVKLLTKRTTLFFVGQRSFLALFWQSFSLQVTP